MAARHWSRGDGRPSAAAAALKVAYQQGVSRQAGDLPSRAFLLQQGSRSIRLRPARRISAPSSRAAGGAAGDGAPGPAHRLREHREPPAGAGVCAAQGNRDQALDGCEPGRLVRQLLTESTVLAAPRRQRTGDRAIAGGELMSRMTGSPAAPALLDVRVLAFTAWCRSRTAILFGVLPAFRTVDIGVADTLGSIPGRWSPGARGSRCVRRWSRVRSPCRSSSSLAPLVRA